MKAITTRFLPATSYRPARIVAHDLDNNKVTIPFDHDRETHEGPYRKAADALCIKMNWPDAHIAGATKDGYVFVFLKPHHHHNAIGPFEGPGGDSGHSHGEGGQGMGGINDPHQKQRGLHGDEEHEHSAERQREQGDGEVTVAEMAAERES